MISRPFGGEPLARLYAIAGGLKRYFAKQGDDRYSFVAGSDMVIREVWGEYPSGTAVSLSCKELPLPLLAGDTLNVIIT